MKIVPVELGLTLEQERAALEQIQTRLTTSGGGVLKSSKNAAAAQSFLKFITGKKGQEVLQKGTSFEYAVGSDVPSNDKLVPLKELQAPTVDPAKLNSAKVTELMTQAGLL